MQGLGEDVLTFPPVSRQRNDWERGRGVGPLNRRWTQACCGATSYLFAGFPRIGIRHDVLSPVPAQYGSVWTSYERSTEGGGELGVKSPEVFCSPLLASLSQFIAPFQVGDQALGEHAGAVGDSPSGIQVTLPESVERAGRRNTIWLSPAEIEEPFQSTKQNVSYQEHS